MSKPLKTIIQIDNKAWNLRAVVYKLENGQYSTQAIPIKDDRAFIQRKPVFRRNLREALNAACDLAGEE